MALLALLLLAALASAAPPPTVTVDASGERPGLGGGDDRLDLAAGGRARPTADLAAPPPPRWGHPRAAGAAADAPTPPEATITTADAASALAFAAFRNSPTPVAIRAPTVVTDSHWLSRTIARLADARVVGTTVSARWAPGRGDRAAFLLHRGVGRCCDTWCEAHGFPNVTAAEHCMTPIPEAPTLQLAAPAPGAAPDAGTVEGRFLAGALLLPHATRQLRAALQGSGARRGGEESGDGGGGHTVTYAQFVSFFRATGGLIDLNSAAAAGSVAGSRAGGTGGGQRKGGGSGAR